tara:strand:+ start:54685 stop:57228 length:2544 start_codon:yes stop_codon:yes gene_type:complete
MKNFLFFFSFLVITSSYPCTLTEYLVDLDGSDCQDTQKLARPFLQEEQKQRKDKIDQYLGEILTLSMDHEIGKITGIDQTLQSMGVEMSNSEDSFCSLDKMKSSLSCSSHVVEENLKKYKMGMGEDVDSFFNQLSKNFLDRSQLKLENSSDSCMSPAFKKQYELSLFFEANKDVDLKTLLNNESEESSAADFAGLIDDLNYLFWDDFSSDLLSLNTATLEGDTFEDQIKNVLAQTANSDFASTKAKESCQQMYETLDSFLCSNMTDYSINDHDFNQDVLNYNSVDLENGFDIFTLELSGADIEKSYRNFILNCPQENTDDSISSLDKDTVDKHLSILDMPFKELEEKVGNQIDQAQKSVVNQNDLEQKMCSLLSCEELSFNEIPEGGSCTLREGPRTREEVETLLNCPQDDQCHTREFRSLISTLERTAPLRARRPQTILKENGETEVIQAHSGLSSFGNAFLLDNHRQQVTATTQVNSQTPGTAAAAATETPSAQGVVGPAVEEEGPSFLSASIPSTVERRERANRRANTDTARAQVQSPNPTTATWNPQTHPYESMGKKVNAPINSHDLRAAYEARNLAEDRDRERRTLETMETQRRTMEEMLGVMRDTAGIQNELASQSSQRVSLPEIARANSYQDHIYTFNNEESAAQETLREREENYLRNVQRDRQAEIQRSAFRDTTGDNSERAETNLMAPVGSGSPSKNGDPSNSSAGARGGSSSGSAALALSPGESGGGGSTAPARIGDINALLDEFNQMPENVKIETTVSDIVQLTPDSLKKSGIEIDNPFVIVVRDGSGEYTVPVRPSLYRGRTILTPILNDTNANLSQYLRRSPLFSSYYRFQDRS